MAVMLGGAALRLGWLIRSGGWRDAGTAGAPWHPHAATIVISLAFVFVLFLAGPWAYTDAIVGFAHGRADGLLPQLLLLAALIGGAAFGARRAGSWASRRPDPALLLRCFAGGVLMALGSLLIPGSNDGLILVGLPNLQAYAWAAMAAMIVSIFIGLRVQQRVRAARS